MSRPRIVDLNTRRQPVDTLDGGRCQPVGERLHQDVEIGRGRAPVNDMSPIAGYKWTVDQIRDGPRSSPP